MFFSLFLLCAQMNFLSPVIFLSKPVKPHIKSEDAIISAQLVRPAINLSVVLAEAVCSRSTKKYNNHVYVPLLS